MEHWLTADLHLGHVNIIEYCDRPFSDVDSMNEAIVERWNQTVAAEDRVLVLGDVAMGRIDDTLKIARRLNGVKVLLTGNHDRSRPFCTRTQPSGPGATSKKVALPKYTKGSCASTSTNAIGRCCRVIFRTTATQPTSCGTPRSVLRITGSGSCTVMCTTRGARPDVRSTSVWMRGVADWRLRTNLVALIEAGPQDFPRIAWPR